MYRIVNGQAKVDTVETKSYTENADGSKNWMGYVLVGAPARFQFAPAPSDGRNKT